MPAIQRSCSVSGRPFRVDETEQFILRRIGELNPVLCGQALPLPTMHPFEMLRRMLAYGVTRRLFRAPSAVSGQMLLTRYNPALGLRVCSQPEFFSDAVENCEAGQSYDFSRPFFERWGALIKRVILPALRSKNCEDSDYVNAAEDLRRCYLCFSAFRSEDCIYCMTIHGCQDCVDCLGCKECILCYGSRDLTHCYEVHNSSDCHDSQSLFGCYDCRGCHDCYGCCGLTHAEFQIHNEPTTPEQYRAFIKGRRLQSYCARTAAPAECRRFREGLQHKANTLINCESASGAYLLRCENVVQCYNGLASTNCGYLLDLENSHYCYRGYVSGAEFCYTASTMHGALNAFCSVMGGGECNLYSAILQQNCSHCFGCIGLRAKSYCILNRQYKRQAYLDLALRIIAHMQQTGEWGCFFDQRFAPAVYQDSAADDFLEPISLDLAKARGYRVIPVELEPAPAGALAAQDLPDELSLADCEKLSSKSAVCEKTGRPFNFQKPELEFYVRNRIPLPRRHWNERLQELISARELIPAV